MSNPCEKCSEHAVDCKRKNFLERGKGIFDNTSFIGLDVDENPFWLYEDPDKSKSRIWFGSYKMQMHLDQEQVAALIPLLEHFVETGRLP